MTDDKQERDCLRALWRASGGDGERGEEAGR